MMAGRPRSFNREAALLLAMEQFWRDGYEETTVARLTATLGITPPSLYAAFGDKGQLFHAAAEAYFDQVSGQFERALGRDTAYDGIADLLHITASSYTDSATPPGCFMLTEPRLAEHRVLLRNAIQLRVARGRSEGDVSSDTDSEQVASYLLAVMSGISSRARDGATTADVQGVVSMALAALAGTVRR